jgi:hypothetical protein
MIGMGPYILQRGTPTGDWWQELHPELFQAIVAKEEQTATEQQLHLIDVHNAAMFELTTRMTPWPDYFWAMSILPLRRALQTIHPTGREVA